MFPQQLGPRLRRHAGYRIHLADCLHPHGSNLTLNPPLTPAYDQSTIPYYNLYFSDTWRMKPRFTLTYGLGWTLEMPPTEANGKQVMFVDPQPPD